MLSGKVTSSSFETKGRVPSLGTAVKIKEYLVSGKNPSIVNLWRPGENFILKNKWIQFSIQIKIK